MMTEKATIPQSETTHEQPQLLAAGRGLQLVMDWPDEQQQAAQVTKEEESAAVEVCQPSVESEDASLNISVETLQALKIARDAQVVNRKFITENPHIQSSPAKFFARVLLGEIVCIVDAQRISTWATSINKSYQGERISFELTAESGLSLSCRRSKIRFAPQPERNFAGDAIELEVGAAGGAVLLKSAPSKDALKSQRKTVAHMRKVEKAHKAAVKRAQELRNLERELEKHLAATVASNEYLAAHTVTQAIQTARAVRDARRTARGLEMMVKTPGEYIFEYLVKYAIDEELSYARRTFDAYTEALTKMEGYCPKKGWSRHAAQERERRQQKHKQALQHFQQTALNIFYQHVSRKHGEDVAEAVRWRYTYDRASYAHHRAQVRSAPRREAALVVEVEEARTAALDARRELEQLEKRAPALKAA